MKAKTIISILLFLLIAVFSHEVFAQNGRRVHAKKHVRNHRRTTVVNTGAAHRRPVAHYRYRHLPRRGVVVRSVGVGYAGIAYRGIGYRFHKGVWYRPRGARFIVVRAPLGIRVRALPVGYTRIVVGPRPYFYYGTFYVKTDGQEEEYEVVEAPAGAEVDALPEGYEVVNINGEEYYQLDDVYYKPKIYDNGDESYAVVEDPTK